LNNVDVHQFYRVSLSVHSSPKFIIIVVVVFVVVAAAVILSTFAAVYLVLKRAWVTLLIHCSAKNFLCGMY
jgi:hypothetical protein